MRSSSKSVFFIVLIISIFCLSCKKDKNVDTVEVIKQYYQALNDNDYEKLSNLFYDSIRMKENDYIYAASKEDYYSKFQWDSVFQSKYEILELKEVEGGVEVEISKTDARILFLNEESNVNKEFFQFKEGKIIRNDILSYLVFNWDTWSYHRSKLIEWINENHPELSGFLQDQSKKGALNYLRAIKLYESAH